MYYVTDGDAGYYNIHLFSTAQKAKDYMQKRNNAYGNVQEIEVK